MAYRVALGTGFRADEMRSLTPGSFRMDDTPPVVVCEAGYTKNGHRAEQPIPEALAALLRPWLAIRPSDRPVFKLRRPAETFRRDLAAAGIAPETAAGTIDFHALRATYVSHLVASGASVKTCQELARHATASLTIGIYAKASLHDIAVAVESLPDLTPAAAHPEALVATGANSVTSLCHDLTAQGQRAGAGRGGTCRPVSQARTRPRLQVLTITPWNCRGLSRPGGVRREWAEPGSNRRHQDFQSCALPAELSARFMNVC